MGVVKIGLDMYLQLRAKNRKLKIFNRLNSQDDSVEVMYWRKAFRIHDWFVNKFNIENCVEQPLTKQEFSEFITFCEKILFHHHQKLSGGVGDEYVLDLIDADEFEEQIDIMKSLLNKIDWELEEITYYAWW